MRPPFIKTLGTDAGDGLKALNSPAWTINRNQQAAARVDACAMCLGQPLELQVGMGLRRSCALPQSGSLGPGLWPGWLCVRLRLVPAPSQRGT